MKNKQRLVQYLIYVAIALIVFVICIVNWNLFEASTAKERLHILSDSFLMPGALLGGIGALGWIASHGTFDMLGYAFSSLKSLMLHPREKQESFLEYKLRKEEKTGWPVEMFVVGMICIFASVICLGIYLV